MEVQQIWVLWVDFGTVRKLFVFKSEYMPEYGSCSMFDVWIWISDVIVVIVVFSCYGTILFFTVCLRANIKVGRLIFYWRCVNLCPNKIFRAVFLSIKLI